MVRLVGLGLVLSHAMVFPRVSQHGLPGLGLEQTHAALIHEATQVLGFHMTPQVGGDFGREGTGGADMQPLSRGIEGHRHLLLH